MTTTDRVLELIEHNKITAKEFANMCHLSPGNVTDWKTGRSKPSIDSLKKIADYFNVNIEWLLGENGIKHKKDLYMHLDFPNDFKYYVEDLPDFIIFRIKFLTFSFLGDISFRNDTTNIEKEINLVLDVYNIPYRFRKDMKKAIIYLYNYNVRVGYDNGMKYKLEKELKQKHNNSPLSPCSSNIELKYYSCPIYRSHKCWAA